MSAEEDEEVVVEDPTKASPKNRMITKLFMLSILNVRSVYRNQVLTHSAENDSKIEVFNSYAHREKLKRGQKQKMFNCFIISNILHIFAGIIYMGLLVVSWTLAWIVCCFLGGFRVLESSLSGLMLDWSNYSFPNCVLTDTSSYDITV